MKRVFVDANVFLRFFTQDDDGQHEKAQALFTSAESGKIELVSGPPVLLNSRGRCEAPMPFHLDVF